MMTRELDNFRSSSSNGTSYVTIYHQFKICFDVFIFIAKIDKKMSTLDRAFISFGITDEIFALASSTYERVGRNYMLGLILFPVFCWTLGTFIGGSATALMPETLRNALGIAILWHVFSHHYSSSQN